MPVSCETCSNIVNSKRNTQCALLYSVFDGFDKTTPTAMQTPTIVEGPVALRCDYRAINPPPGPNTIVQWSSSSDGSSFSVVDQQPDPLAGRRVLYLDEGRYLYIEALTEEQRNMRYRCSVTLMNGAIMISQITYTLNHDLPDGELVVYRELGTETVELMDNNGQAMLVYASAARNGNIRAPIAISCPAAFPVSVFVVTVPVTSDSETPMTITCSLVGGPASPSIINGTVIITGELQVPKSLKPFVSLVFQIKPLLPTPSLVLSL